MSPTSLDLGYAFAAPATVLVTTDDQHPVENTLTLVVTNRSGAAVEFQNPQGLTPQSALPAWNDQASPLGRISVWFPWGDAAGDLARPGDATRIVASSLGDVWAASPRMTDPTLGVYWTLFPLSKTVFLERDASISFQFSRIVSHVGTGGRVPEQTWMTALPRVPGYTSEQSHTAVWKQDLSVALTAPATAIPGDQLELSWTSAGAEYCSLSPGGFDNLPATGRQPVKMPAEPSVTYTVTAHPASGRPVSDAKTVLAQSGWIDLGPCPAWAAIEGSLLYAVGPRYFCFNSGRSGVWTSADGRSWTRGADLQPLEGTFGATDGSRLWAMGRDSPDGQGNGPPVVASTTDGSRWEVHTGAPWQDVHFAAGAFFQNALWVLGGWRPSGRGNTQPSNGVWRSADGGVSWTQQPDAPWQTDLAITEGQVAVFAGRLWVMVGGRELWASANGRDWARQQPLPWAGTQTYVQNLAATDRWLYGLAFDGDHGGVAVLWRMDRNQSWTSFATPKTMNVGSSWGLAPFGSGVLMVAHDAFRFVPPVAGEGRASGDPALTLGYAFDEPATVLVTIDDQHPVENTLTLVVTNRSGAAVEFQNPDALSPSSTLPAWNDQQSPLGRISVWFPWGDASGDLAYASDAQRIVATSLDAGWAASPRMSDPDLGVYWTLFPLSKSTFVEKDASISFQFSGIVSHVGSGGHVPEQSWMTAAPRVPGYTAQQGQVAVWKNELSATLTAPATAAPGDDLALVWDTAGVDSCDLDPGELRGLPPNGHEQVTMPASPSITWTLTAYPRAGGSPIHARASVEAQTGWTDLGPVPAGLPRERPVLLWLGDRLLLLGETGGSWTSTDGAKWHAGGSIPFGTIVWPPNGAATVSDGRPWVIGVVLFDTVWKLYLSPDGGMSWPVVNPSLPFSVKDQVVRAATAFGSVWVFAGSGVWSSQDAVHWSQHASPPWSDTQSLPAAAAFAGRLWAFADAFVGRGGQLARHVWSSSDGESWSQGPMAPWDSGQWMVGATATRTHAYVATHPQVGSATLWQMDANQTWTSVQMPDDLKNAGFAATALALSASAGRLFAYNGVGHMWAYTPPLAEEHRADDRLQSPS